MVQATRQISRAYLHINFSRFPLNYINLGTNSSANRVNIPDGTFVVCLRSVSLSTLGVILRVFRISLQLLLRKKAAEELKKEQERKAAERRRIIEERCGKPKIIDDANEGTLLRYAILRGIVKSRQNRDLVFPKRKILSVSFKLA